MSKDNKDQPAAEATGPEFAIQRLYTKDTSFEAPNSPKIFLEQWEPELNMDLGTKNVELGDNAYEVELTVTVTVKLKEKIAFLVEVKQAGIFTLAGFPEDQIEPMLGAFCPNVLYPYAREAITTAVVRAGFPQLYLTPVNFDALYEQHRKQAEKGDAKTEKAAEH